MPDPSPTCLVVAGAAVVPAHDVGPRASVGGGVAGDAGALPAEHRLFPANREGAGMLMGAFGGGCSVGVGSTAQAGQATACMHGAAGAQRRTPSRPAPWRAPCENCRAWARACTRLGRELVQQGCVENIVGGLQHRQAGGEEVEIVVGGQLPCVPGGFVWGEHMVYRGLREEGWGARPERPSSAQHEPRLRGRGAQHAWRRSAQMPRGVHASRDTAAAVPHPPG